MAGSQRPLTPPDDTWKHTYSSKPDWWDIENEPRCDVCGIHCEEVGTITWRPSNESWCGNCGNCSAHCTCKALGVGTVLDEPLAAWEAELLYEIQAPPQFSSTEEAQHWLDTHSSGG